MIIKGKNIGVKGDAAPDVTMEPPEVPDPTPSKGKSSSLVPDLPPNSTEGVPGSYDNKGGWAKTPYSA